jgi:hypothetical protein
MAGGIRMRRITQSEVVTYGKCPRLHKFKYIELLRPRSTDSMRRGTAVHLGVEKGDPSVARDYVLSFQDKVFGREAKDELRMTAAVCEAMVQGALLLWPNWPKDREVEFDMPLINPETGRPSRVHRFAGVIDGLSDDSVTELKTTSRLDASYIDRLDVDFQISWYLEAASRIKQRPIRKMNYAVIRWPSSKQRKKETVEEYIERIQKDYQDRPDFYFHLEPVTRSEEQMKLWRMEAWELHKRILAVENGAFAPRNTESCVGRYGRCRFLDLCCGAVSRDSYDVVSRPHQELSEGNTL